MAQLRPKNTENKDRVLKKLEEIGELTIQGLADEVDISYWTVRRMLEKLVEEDKVYVSRVDGKTLYFMSKNSTALPSINIVHKRVSLTRIANSLLEKPLILSWVNDNIKQAIASAYAQPMLAQTKSAINEDQLKNTQTQLNQAITNLEAALVLLKDVRMRCFLESVDQYRNWFNDDNYDASVAYQLYQQTFDDIILEDSAAELNVTTPVES